MGKVFFFDLDGVLIYNDVNICPYVEEALEGLKAKGHHPVVCTGRGTSNIPSFFREHCEGWISAAGCYCWFDGTLLFSHVIDKEDVLNILKEAEHMNIPIYPESDDHVYAFMTKENEDDPREQFLAQVSDIFVGNTDEWIEKYYNSDVCKFSTTVKYIEQLRKLSCLEDKCILVDTSDGYYEVNQRYVSKGTAIKEFLNHVGLDPKDAICFGDSENDLEMFETCGCPIATGNASDSIKQKASFVTKPADQGGVFHFLKEHKYID